MLGSGKHKPEHIGLILNQPQGVLGEQFYGRNRVFEMCSRWQRKERRWAWMRRAVPR